jgi:glycerol kinase
LFCLLKHCLNCLPDGTTYALEGSIAITGAAVQWLRDNLGLIQDAAETEAIAGSVADAGGIYFVLAFSGLFAPYWDMDARGVIVRLTRYVNRAHLVRAMLEAICYQTRDVLEAMRADSGIELATLKCRPTGGWSASLAPNGMSRAAPPAIAAGRRRSSARAAGRSRVNQRISKSASQRIGQSGRFLAR